MTTPPAPKPPHEPDQDGSVLLAQADLEALATSAAARPTSPRQLGSNATIAVHLARCWAQDSPPREGVVAHPEPDPSQTS